MTIYTYKGNIIDNIINNDKEEPKQNYVSDFEPILEMLKKHKENKKNELFCVLYEDKKKNNISNYVRNMIL